MGAIELQLEYNQSVPVAQPPYLPNSTLQRLSKRFLYSLEPQLQISHLQIPCPGQALESSLQKACCQEHRDLHIRNQEPQHSIH
nr:hypothetical protein Iba_chr12eCG12170 [Ipomoea batatas]